MFDLSKKYDDGFSPLPAGQYNVAISSCEWKESSTGNEYLNVGFKVFGEKYSGRVIFEKFNLFHSKEQVKEIALAQLQRLALSCGYSLENLTNVGKEEIVELILGRELSVTLKIQKSNDYGDQNKVSKYGLVVSTYSQPKAGDFAF